MENSLMNAAQNQKRKILFACRVKDEDTDAFFSAHDEVEFTQSSAPSGAMNLPDRGPERPARLGYIYSPEEFLKESYFYQVVSSIAVEVNIPYMISYLEKIGFTEVVVERRSNEHNNRQNAWMVRAVKI
jgi:hypothetical protein